MTKVIYAAYCPECGRDIGLAGVSVYENPPIKRVVACTCGSYRVPVEMSPKGRT
jgi:hypothetical protein